MSARSVARTRGVPTSQILRVPDDVASPVTAITTAPAGWVVLIAAGDYPATANITIARDLTIVGPGARLHRAATVGGDFLRVIGGAAVRIAGLEIAFDEGSGAGDVVRAENGSLLLEDARVGPGTDDCVLVANGASLHLRRVDVSGCPEACVTLRSPDFIVEDAVLHACATTLDAGLMIEAAPGPQSRLVHLTVVGNGPLPAVQCQPPARIEHAIVFGNLGAPSPQCTFIESIVQGGAAGFGNLATDPLFVAPLSGDYRLQLTSPARDQSSISNHRLDAAGAARDAIPDLGAFEATP